MPNQEQPSEEAAGSEQDIPGMPGDGRRRRAPGIRIKARRRQPATVPWKTEEWAHVVAGTANMRSEPDHALASDLCASVRLAGPGDLLGSPVGCRCKTPIAAPPAGSNPRRSGPVQGQTARAGYGGYPPGQAIPTGATRMRATPYPPPWGRRPARTVFARDFGNFLGRVSRPASSIQVITAARRHGYRHAYAGCRGCEPPAVGWALMP